MFTSSLYLAALLSSLVASTVTRKLGRKLSMLFGGILFFAGALVNGFAKAVWMLIVGRMLLGFGIGFANQVITIIYFQALDLNLVFGFFFLFPVWIQRLVCWLGSFRKLNFVSFHCKFVENKKCAVWKEWQKFMFYSFCALGSFFICRVTYLFVFLFLETWPFLFRSVFEMVLSINRSDNFFGLETDKKTCLYKLVSDPNMNFCILSHRIKPYLGFLTSDLFYTLELTCLL